MRKDTAEMSAASGIVRTHAQTMRPATPHLTAESLRVAEAGIYSAERLPAFIANHAVMMRDGERGLRAHLAELIG